MISPFPNSTRRRIQQSAWMILIVLQSVASLTGAESEQATSKEPVRNSIDFESFSFILDNNIFDSNRQDRERLEAERRRNQQRSIPVERFALVGTMHNEGEAFAFFAGTERDYQSVLEIDQSIAGYTVKEISKEIVTLEKEGEQIEFRIGMEMTRTGDEPWKLIENSSGNWGQSSGRSRSARSTSTSSPSATTSNPLSGSKSDILKKMMERRKQQMTK